MIQRSATRARLVLAMLTTFGALSLTSGAAQPALAQQVPPAPAPVPVTLDSSTTALLILDINQQICASNPICVQNVLPAVESLQASARAAGALVVYSSANNTPIMDDIAPLPSETVLGAVGQNRFFDSPLDDILRSHGVTTLVIVGWKANGSVLYTSFGADNLRYTSVVPEDGTDAPTPVDKAIGFYQMQNQQVSNPNNQPLLAGGVTLSRSDLITFQ